MCHKNRLFNFHFWSSHYLRYVKSKNSSKYHKILMSRFWKIAFCLPLLFRRHVCLSKLKHSPSRVLPLTARKTVFSHLKRNNKTGSIVGQLCTDIQIKYLVYRVSLYDLLVTYPRGTEYFLVYHLILLLDKSDKSSLFRFFLQYFHPGWI